MVTGEELAIALMAEEAAHELAGPVAFLRGLMESLAAGAPLAEEDRDLARAEVGRLLALVASFRGCRIPSGPLEPLPLAALIDDVGGATPAISVDARGVDPSVRVMVEGRLAVAMLRRTFSWAAARSPAGAPIVLAATARGGRVSLDLRVDAASPADRGRLRPWNAPPEDLSFLLARHAARSMGGGLVVEGDRGEGARLRIIFTAAPA